MVQIGKDAAGPSKAAPSESGKSRGWLPVAMSVLAMLGGVTLVSLTAYYAACSSSDIAGIGKHRGVKDNVATESNNGAKNQDSKVYTLTRRGTKWIREDLLPQHVMLYMDGEYITEDQHPWYKDRAFMYPNNGSMYILDPEPKDTGLYVCFLVYDHHGFLVYMEDERVNLTVVDEE